MAITKTYYVAKVSNTQGFNFIFEREKVAEYIFYDLLKAKLKELIGEERKDQFDKCLQDVTEAFESKTPVTIGDRNFEIKSVIKKFKHEAK
ncbi:hypothetical protein [Flavobacterium sp.]|uniref:hypothetical protein n=1 Tax=Flavobacterium sp. TaxID=239 RepID=UPI002602B623|nr:hypothetical protein [Flavobacterium sp.]